MTSSDIVVYKLLLLTLLRQVLAFGEPGGPGPIGPTYDHGDRNAVLQYEVSLLYTIASYTFNDDPDNLEVDGVSEFVNHREAALGYISWNTDPQFVTRQGEMGVKCQYSEHFGVVNHDNELHKKTYTNLGGFPLGDGVKSYGIRFSLDAKPSKGGGGKYKKHGMFLAGFYEGPKFGITVKGCIYVSLQSRNTGDGKWFGAVTNECKLVTQDGEWHEIVVQLNRVGEDVSIYIFFDGNFKPVAPLEKENGPFDKGIRENDLSAYHVCSDPKDKNALKGVISKFIITTGLMFRQPPWLSFDIIYDVNGDKAATYMDLNQETWDAGPSHSFGFNEAYGFDTLFWDIVEPEFQQIAFEEGVICKYEDSWGYQDFVHSIESHEDHTVDNTHNTNIISYAVRFSLNADPKRGGGGTYKDHGYFLAGFYEGGKVGITPKGCIYYSFQSKTTWAGDVSQECNLVSKDGLWHEVVVTVDNNDNSDVKVFIWLDGVPLSLESSGPHDDGVRTSGLSNFHICSDPKDKNALDGVITKVLVYGDYLIKPFIPPAWLSFDLINDVNTDKAATYMELNQKTWDAGPSHSFGFNEAYGFDTLFWDVVEPEFQQIESEEGVICKYEDSWGYQDFVHSIETHEDHTVDNTHNTNIISYAVRFSLNADPKRGGGGTYKDHGYFLAGFYEGGKVGITPKGCIYFSFQSKTTWAGDVSRECNLVSKDGLWHEIVVTVDNNDNSDVKVFIWLDGVGLPLESGGPHDDGVRTSGLSNFHICSDPKDKNALDGVITKVLVYGDYLIKPEPCDYECPENSENSNSPLCARKFKDCSCNDGYKPSEATEMCEACDYECPENSSNKKQPKCAEKFKHCKCNAGYKVNKKTSQCEECYQCPVNSTPKKDCPTGFNHCRCVDGSFRNKNSEECEID